MIFGAAPVDTAGFRQAVNRAHEDPLQRPTRQVTRWKPIEQSLSRPTVPKRTRTVRKNPPLRPTSGQYADDDL
ncbi:hypothetical protein C7E18_22130, partial [Stenotrophomonas maltophilia]